MGYCLGFLQLVSWAHSCLGPSYNLIRLTALQSQPINFLAQQLVPVKKYLQLAVQPLCLYDEIAPFCQP
jgi:hypothetical protein